MRVLAGALKGRRLVTPRGSTTRPTADQVRIALMDTLTPRLPDARLLDLFAGAGGVGFEALSRGAAHVTFVERDARAVAALRTNVETLGVAAQTRVERAEVATGLARLGREGARFDLVFLDPPYAGAAEAAAQLLPALAPHLAETASARIVFEHDRRVTLPDQFGDLRCADRRRYGDTAVSFYAMTPGVAP